MRSSHKKWLFSILGVALLGWIIYQISTGASMWQILASIGMAILIF